MAGGFDESSGKTGDGGEPAEAAAAGAGLKPWQRRKKAVASRKPAQAQQEEAESGDAAAAPAKPWQRKKNPVASPKAGGAADNDGAANDDVAVVTAPRKPWQKPKSPAASPKAGGAAINDDAANDDVVVATAPLKPWQKQRSAAASPKVAALEETAAAETGDGDAVAVEGVVAGDEDGSAAAAAAAAPVKPWLRKNKRPVGGVELSSDDAADAAVAAKPWKVAAAAKAAAEKFDDVLREGVAASGKGERDGESGGAGVGVAGLEAGLEDRDWKKRVAVFEVYRSLDYCCNHAAGRIGLPPGERSELYYSSTKRLPPALQRWY